jgi:hypothetical protein
MRAGQRLPPELKIESVMPLILVGNAQEPAALQQEVTDYHVVSGGLRVGRIYKRKSAMRSESQWLWDISGVHAAPGVMRLAGTTTTLEQAHSELKANWEKWMGDAATNQQPRSFTARPDGLNHRAVNYGENSVRRLESA